MAKWQTRISNLDPNGLFSKFVLPKCFLKRIKETRFRQEWKLSQQEYQHMMKNPLWYMYPKQRGGIMLSAQATMAGAQAATGGTVVMTGDTAFFTEIDGTVSAGFKFNNDGSIDEVGPGAATYNQVDPGEWWSAEPETDIGSSYDVRALSGGTGTWSVAAAADDTWIAMSADRVWRVTIISKNAPDVASATRTFEVRTTGAGSALDSGLYSASVEN